MLVDCNSRNGDHPPPQIAGRPSGADAGVWGPGAPRHPSSDGLLVAPPHPWNRGPGTPVFEPPACHPSDRYRPLMPRLTVDLPGRAYPVLVGLGALQELPRLVKEMGATGAAVVSDRLVAEHWAEPVIAGLT